MTRIAGNDPTPFCIPLLSVKSLGLSLIKLFPGLIQPATRNIHQQSFRSFLECHMMETTKNSLDLTIVYSSPNISYIAKN